jgi:NADP-dependent 3-hydroxy acid dehydrogenase YdfG
VLLVLLGQGKRLPAPKCLVITGATAGIGEGLALHYAKPGVTLALTGRNSARLDAVAKECTQRCVVVPLQLLGPRLSYRCAHTALAVQRRDGEKGKA